MLVASRLNIVFKALNRRPACPTFRVVGGCAAHDTAVGLKRNLYREIEGAVACAARNQNMALPFRRCRNNVSVER